MKYPSFTPSPPTSALIGHRGIARHAPENTMTSFKLAAQQKIDWIEFDLRLTGDKELIIFHDDRLERTTNGFGWVHEHTLEEIAKLDAGSWFEHRFKGEAIPVFKDVLPELLTLFPQMNIELKITPEMEKEHESALAWQVINVLAELWPAKRAWPLISSFYWPVLEKIREVLPDIPIGFLQETCTPYMIEKVASTPNSSLHCDYQSLSEEMLHLCQKANVPLLVYTVNQPEIAKRLIDHGIFGVFSDDPRHLLSLP